MELQKMALLSSKRKEDAGNYRRISLTVTPGKVMEQPILETISRRKKDKDMIWSQHGFTKELEEPDSLLQWNGLVGEGRAVEIFKMSGLDTEQPALVVLVEQGWGRGWLDWMDQALPTSTILSFCHTLGRGAVTMVSMKFWTLLSQAGMYHDLCTVFLSFPEAAWTMRYSMTERLLIIDNSLSSTMSFWMLLQICGCQW